MFTPPKYALVVPAILLLISSCGNNESVQTEPIGPHITVAVQAGQSTGFTSEVNLTGTVNPATATIVFKNSGILEKGEIMLAERSTFKKGQLLCQINNKGAYKELTAIKKEVIDELNALMPEIKRTLPYKAIDKWKSFIDALRPVALLPAYPSTRLPEEKDLPKLESIGKTYQKAVELEKKMKDFFYIAPFDGTINFVMINEGDDVKAGAKVATLINTEGQQLEVIVPKAQLKQFSKSTSYPLVDSKGKTLGTAKFSSSTFDEKGKLICAFNMQLAKGQKATSGSKLTVQVGGGKNQPALMVDADQVCHDSVQIVQNGKIEKIPVKVLGREGGFMRVSGIFPDQQILVDAYETIPADIRFLESKK